MAGEANLTLPSSSQSSSGDRVLLEKGRGDLRALTQSSLEARLRLAEVLFNMRTVDLKKNFVKPGLVGGKGCKTNQGSK